MNKRIFISGSISIKMLDDKILKSLLNIQQKNFDVLVGDAHGVDELIQNYFSRQNYFNLTIYHIDKIRVFSNFNFKTKKVNFDERLEDKKNKERERQSFKDRKMVQDCDWCYCIWDGKSNGTYNNMCEAIKLQKEIKLYLPKTQKEHFARIGKFSEFRALIDEIYRENNGFSLQDIYDEIKSEFNPSTLKSCKDLKKLLLEKSFIKQVEIGNKKVFAPVNESYGIKNLYKGNVSSYSFSNDFFEEIRRIFKMHSQKINFD